MEDSWDPDHGQREADLVGASRALRMILPEAVIPKLAEACLRHESGHRCPKDESIGACWDADRLNLVRMGRPLDPDRFGLLDVRDLDLLGPAMTMIVCEPPSREESVRRVEPQVVRTTPKRQWRGR
ncbi:hypothetical protein [Cereibacter johrii]|uniref:hypothetical protein n=1 Tax=Cereibacter johrii TaxID=445629 RepID=UPI003CE8F65E